jgi:hypothetical protein
MFEQIPGRRLPGGWGMGVVGFVLGAVVASVIVYPLMVMLLAPAFTDARNFGEAGDTWIGTLSGFLG